MEADFQRFYGLDLADLWRGTLGARKAGVLAMHLPPDSAVMRREGGAGSRTVAEKALEAIIHGQQAQMAQQAGEKPPSPPADPPTYRERQEKAARLEARQNRYLAKYQAQLDALGIETKKR